MLTHLSDCVSGQSGTPDPISGHSLAWRLLSSCVNLQRPNRDSTALTHQNYVLCASLLVSADYLSTNCPILVRPY